jgi:hypothetical protein
VTHASAERLLPLSKAPATSHEPVARRIRYGLRLLAG